ncbi:metalloregulator ArsR/SmtB family transcription factor [Leifsonia sp. F6_8S_P_1B]|uniref:Metalloregulator ArsR/SmtB family transcription factor n=1 Tax=Leifsonia williamsii TaxID=3035919 RepID=A0ABT8K9E7_9MICO|nr:metalloregulator ArsR/SmtB family transcription factor [Leifsonia williamsii]MDN4613441.1 metalloregulator ArsR/SmtB family transcription factor [Leifsonia williamsii]
MEVHAALAALAEPTRFRIIALLAERPMTVGEVAVALGALQPQTSKHLQALEAAGVIRIHRLGRRRVATLDRDAMGAIAEWFSGLAAPQADDTVLAEYAAGIAAVQERAADGPRGAAQHLVLERVIPAAGPDVWHAWTDPRVATLWWAPRHFDVVRCEVSPTPGAPVSLVLREGDGAEYSSVGRVQEVEPERRLVYELSPVDAEGRPQVRVLHDVVLEPDEAATRVRLTLRAEGAGPEAAPMLAGLQPGWEQLLDGLAELLAVGRRTRRPLGWEA